MTTLLSARNKRSRCKHNNTIVIEHKKTTNIAVHIVIYVSVTCKKKKSSYTGLTISNSTSMLHTTVGQHFANDIDRSFFRNFLNRPNQNYKLLKTRMSSDNPMFELTSFSAR